MRFFGTMALALAFATGSASKVGAQSAAPQPHSYWHVCVDGAGTTHQNKCEFRDFRPLSLGKGVEAIFVDGLFSGYLPMHSGDLISRYGSSTLEGQAE